MNRRRLGTSIMRGVVLAIVTAWTLFPIYYIVMLALTPWDDLFRPVYWVKHPTLENFKFVLFQQSPFVKFFWRWLGNSLLVSGAVMVAVLGVAAMGSFALGRIRFGLGRYVSGMTLFTYIIPASFLSIPFFKIMGDYDLLDTYWALIFAMTTFAAPLCALGAVGLREDDPARDRRVGGHRRRGPRVHLLPDVPAADHSRR